MIKILRFFTIVAVLLLSKTASAQLVCATPTSCTLTAATVPQSVTVAWDTEAQIPTAYTIYSGATALQTVGGTVTQATVSLPVFQTYQLTITATNATGESPRSNVVTVLLQQLQTPPPAPTNFRIIAPGGGGCATTSPLGTTATTVTDSGCHVFTLNGNQTLRDGVFVGAGSATMYTYVASGVYCLGTDNNWYSFNNSTLGWVSTGSSIKPVS